MCSVLCLVRSLECANGAGALLRLLPWFRYGHRYAVTQALFPAEIALRSGIFPKAVCRNAGGMGCT